MTKSFLTNLSKLFEGNLDYFPKLKKFLKEKGFEYQDNKYVMAKELSKISNIQQQYGFEVEYIEADNKFRIMWYSNDSMKSSAKPIEAENEEQTIVIITNLLDRFLNPKNNGLMGNLLK